MKLIAIETTVFGQQAHMKIVAKGFGDGFGRWLKTIFDFFSRKCSLTLFGPIFVTMLGTTFELILGPDRPRNQRR